MLSTWIFGLSRIYFLCVACSRDQFSWFSTWCFYFTLSELLVRMGIFSFVHWSCELFVLLVCSFSCWIFVCWLIGILYMSWILALLVICFANIFSQVCGLFYHNILASLVAQTVKNLSTMQEMGRLGFDRWVRKIPWRNEWLPIPVVLPGEFHEQRSLVG